MTQRRIRALSVDVHGTLLLPRASIGELYAEGCRRHGIMAEAATLEAAFFAAFKKLRQQWPVPYGRDEADARAFWFRLIAETVGPACHDALCDDLFTTFAAGSTWHRLPQAAEAIALGRDRGLPVIGCSNFDSRVRGLLRHHDLHLDDLVISAEIGKAKPDPAPLHAVAERAGCAIEAVLHIGDNEGDDGGAARAAGCAWLPVDRGAGIDLDALRQLLDQPS